MFGFLNPRPHSNEYRRAYARLCQHQHAHYGLWSLAFHSYEAVFLYQWALDAGAVPASTLPNQRCCKLMARRSIRQAPDSEVGRFCASLGLLLGSIKLEDDWRDSRRWLAGVGRWLLRKQIASARSYFSRLDSRFARNIEQLLADHAKLEKRGTPIELNEYVEPAAHSFGYVFGLMAKLAGMPSQSANLISLGRSLGAALIAFDCAVDWKRDRRRGEFNPLPDEEAVHRALLASASWLDEAAANVTHAFGPQARSAATINVVRERILQIDPLSNSRTCEVKPAGVWTRLKCGVRQSLRLAALPVLAAMSASGNSEESSPPGDEPPHSPNDGKKKGPIITTKNTTSGGGASDCACPCICIDLSCCDAAGCLGGC